MRDVPIDMAATASPGALDVRHGEPVTLGIPFPRGCCWDANPPTIVEDDRPVHTQLRALDRWNDGSIRWALADWQTSVSGSGRCAMRVDAGERPRASPLASRTIGDVLEIETGAATFHLAPDSACLFREVLVDGRPVLDPAQSPLVVMTGEDSCTVRFDRLALEETGAMRCVVRADGWAGPRHRERLLQLIVRLHFFAHSAVTRIALTVRNPQRARHHGGIWELGDPGSICIGDLSFHFSFPPGAGPCEAACSPEIDSPLRAAALPLELYQESSGGENWASPVHRNRDGVVPLQARGYRLDAGGQRSAGLRATPIVSLRSAERTLAIAVPAFWENFPRAIEARDGSMVIRLFPRQFADDHELQGGEQKTHVFSVAFAPDSISRVPLDWCRQPQLPILSPAWYASAGAVRFLVPASDNHNREHQALIDSAIEGPHAFVRKREMADEYGWRNFGELYADHEAIFEPERLVVSHHNNQYDAVAAFANHFMRTGDRRWWALMDDLARHVADIDVYRTDRDKSAYNHGLFWHTAHHLDAGRSTHRTYPRAPGVRGGGPANEHNYATGLMLHHFLTGDPLSRDTAIGLAQWVVDMDDGGKTRFRWLSRADTGLASQTGTSARQVPGRGAGHSIRALLDGHRLSANPAFLAKAEAIIRRVVHPDDDIGSRHLLEPESGWSYTACLQALGEYLEYKSDLGQFDTAYAYARATLLHYAGWMADHEYPYLDAPEKLEYPNETWAAQDLRKTDVFHYAARHALASDRIRFRERAAFFFDTAIATLNASPTSGLTRPTVLLLTNGLLETQARFGREVMVDARPDLPMRFAAPDRFIPQKALAARRLAAVAAAGFCAALAGLAWLAR